jgi:hypothetical protein
MAGMASLTFTFPVVALKNRHVGERNESSLTLTPSQCFSKCVAIEKCHVATFTSDLQFSRNCFLFESGQATDSQIGQNLWTSFVKYREVMSAGVGLVS